MEGFDNFKKFDLITLFQVSVWRGQNKLYLLIHAVKLQTIRDQSGNIFPIQTLPSLFIPLWFSNFYRWSNMCFINYVDVY